MEAVFETLVVDASGPVGSLTLNRPEKLNPLSLTTLRELVEAARWFDGQRQVRAVVVGGAGGTFSAGFDVASFHDADPELGERGGAELGYRMVDAVESIEAITVAAIGRHCIGGALLLAAACDLRVAADDTYFSIPEVDLGIPLTWGGIPRLVREIGPALTRELVMTCRPFTADEARAAGFLNRVVPMSDVEPTAHELAGAIAARPRVALSATKRGVAAVLESMASTRHGWADADGMVAALHDDEARASGARYLERFGRGG